MCDCHEHFKNSVDELHIKYDGLQATVEENTNTMKSHIADTESIVKFVRDLEGFIRFTHRIQKFCKWLAGLAVVGGVITYISNHFPLK
jgi:hypothetical protein